MTSDLRQRAALAACTHGADCLVHPDVNGLHNFDERAEAPTAAEPETERLQPVDAPEGQDDDPPAVAVHVAIARVMRDLGKIAKADRYDSNPGQTRATRYNFRGIDRVVNAVSAVTRKHGVLVVPQLVTAEYRDVERKEGGRSHECLVTMRYAWHGPAGDEPIVATVAGEALDTSDKATAKAQSVAWRVCLIQMLQIPTGDPDPDSVRIERGEQPLPKAGDYRDEATHPGTSLGRLRQMRGEVVRHGLGSTLVMNEVGDDEQLLALIDRIGRERKSIRDGEAS